MDYPSGTDLVINSNAIFCYKNLPPSLSAPCIDSEIKSQMTPKTFEYSSTPPPTEAKGLDHILSKIKPVNP